MSWRHLSPLSRKLLRDLWTARGQALAIAVVVAAGISMFTAYLSCFDSLARTRDAFYQRQRLADVFANLVRAPRSLEPRIAEIPGVVTVETRVMAEVTLDLPDLPEPASGRLVSLPHRGPARLNELKLRRGSWPNPSRPDEVLVGEAFANAHRLEPGASLAAILNGRRRELRVVGIALSAEYVYTLRPGELIPDDRRYGVLWMDREALGAAFDLEGGFNEVSLHLAPGASSEEAIRRLDRLLEPFGGRGAIPSSLQPSVWMVDNELDQLATMAVILPSIFLLVAAVVLNIALSRALSLQRTQIAALKALGYHNREIAAHYRAWGLLIAGGGALAGLALGAAIGQSFLTMYNDYFRFPELAYRLSPWLVLAALALSLSTAWLGARRAVRKAVSVPPAEAMRPQAPERFRPTLLERLGAGRFLAPMTRMVLRNLARQPGRAASSIAGIALGGAIVFVGLTFLDSIQLMIDHQFQLSQRQDATVVLTEPRSPAALKALAALPGVLAVEPQRTVAVRFRSGHHHRTGALSGIPADARLGHLVSRTGEVIGLPPDGLVLSQRLAELLEVEPGSTVRVEVLEGKRPMREVRVSRVIDDMLGLNASLEIGALNRLLGEGPVVSGALLELDPGAREALDRQLKQTPAVAGTTFLDAALKAFRKTLAEHLWITLTTIVGFAGVIAFGVVYNTARVSLSERSRELASLRVLGFTRAEISVVLLGELALVVLASLPLGCLWGWWLAVGTMQLFGTDLYRMPLVPNLSTMATAALVVLGAALASALVVRHRLDHLDLVAVLKISE